MVVLVIVLSICGLLTSFGVVGIIPSIIAFGLSTFLFVREKSINLARAMAISAVGIILPFIMYINSYGFALPRVKDERLGFITQMIYDNYSNMGFNMDFLFKEDNILSTVFFEKSNRGSDGDEIYYVSEGATVDSFAEAKENARKTVAVVTTPEGYGEGASVDDSSECGSDKKGILNEVFFNDAEPGSIFESIDSLGDKSTGYGADRIGPSDDDIPSYGGLPMGTLLLGQYFREDDHNCNPILVLQNKTEEDYRYECRFIARDEEGEELAISEKTVEVVKSGAQFVFEGRFDKAELEGKLPDMYEFSVTRRTPYEKDMSEYVAVSSKIDAGTAILTANNVSDKKVKVDAYVLFFDGGELVDCIWMIPQNTGEVCIEQGSAASIKGDAYYRFDRIETYYTAYEAVGE
ncbi:hypothetical protein [Butyrivibrio sp. MC2021]|uniref:hypothetical protein n=1 Tax=Butyrivibrio sp. MC2021 TaxID=1408306 RepID=UPI000479BA32|nr:hypothetical protein [Butyrivibrio sp. MC2021]